MSIKVAIVCCLVFCALAASARADVGAENAGTLLAKKLDEVDHIGFYFTPRTDKFLLNEDLLKKEAGIIVHRKCGKNCRMFLSKVISHLSHSKSVECPEPQLETLIEIGDAVTLQYGYSGRVITFEGSCFYNESRIDSVIKKTDFLFN